MSGPLGLTVRITFYAEPRGIVYQDFLLRCPWNRCAWELVICHHDSAAALHRILESVLEHARNDHGDRV